MRLRDRFLALLPTSSPAARADSWEAPTAPMGPPVVQQSPAGESKQGLANLVTGLGTRRSRGASTVVTRRIWLDRATLDELAQRAIPKRIAGELVADALTTLTLKDLQDPEKILNHLDDIGWRAAFEDAGRDARMYGGAALWMVCEGGGDDVSEPLDYGSLERVVRLVLMSRHELHRAYGVEGASATGLDMDPYSPTYDTPLAYRYTPDDGTTMTGLVIHASRLLRFYGDPVPSTWRSRYEYWGAPVMESCLDEWQQEAMARQGGAEILYEIGGKTITLGNLKDLLTKPGGFEQLYLWLSVQESAFSAIRAWILGPGQEMTAHNTTLSGWDAVYDRIGVQALAAVAGMPISKLWGQAPGGLSTDDQSALNNWSARVRAYQDRALTPAMNGLLRAVLRSSLGPTAGVEPERWLVEWSAYEVPNEAEEAATRKTLIEALAIAVANSAMSPDEMREELRALGVALPADELDEGAPSPADAPPAELVASLTAAAAPPPAPDASALLDIITRVNGGELSYAQALGVLRAAFRLDDDLARAILGEPRPIAEAPAAAVPEAPAPAPEVTP